MCTKFLSKVLSYECRRGTLLFSPGRYFLCCPGKSYPFLRTAATEAASEVYRKNDATSTECPGLFIPLRENFYLKYMLNQEEYRSIVLDPKNLNFETEGRPESVHILKNLNGSLEDEDLIGKLKSSVLKEKEILQVEEICKAFFRTYEHRRNDLAKEIASLLETELLSRKLSKPEIIKVLFTFNETWGRVNVRSYLQMKLKNKICFKICSLTPKQFIAFMYCKFRFSDEVLKVTNFNVINYASNIIPSLDSVELGITATGLLKGNFSSSSLALKKNFLQRTMELSGSMQEGPLFAICKFLKENITSEDGPYLLEFQESLIPHLSKYNYVHLNKLVEVGVRIGCLNSKLWEKVSNMYKENINDCKLQKILSMVSTLTQCDVADEELLKLAVEKFEKAVEDGTIDHSQNRRHLILFLNDLIHHRIYPKKLLDVVFGEGLTFFKSGVKHSHRARAKYWETKCFLDIDKPEFNYNSFSEANAIKLSKLCKYLLFNSKESVNLNNNLYDTLKKMRRILVDSYNDDEKVYLSNWHPVYPNGLFLRFDQNLNAQPIPADFKSLPNYYPKKALKDDHIWVFVGLLPGMCFVGTEKLRLSALTQIRHLQAFGYKPILVHYHFFKIQLVHKTGNEYLNDLINKHLHKTS